MKIKWSYVLCIVLAIFLVGSGCGKSKSNTTKSVQVSDTILDEMEGPPNNGHTLEKHVGKTEEQLKDRVRRENVAAASTYYDKQVATKAVKEGLEKHDQEIQEWLKKGKPDRLVLNTHYTFPVGKSVLKDMSVRDKVTDSVIVLARNPKGKLKYTIITSYPEWKKGS